MSYRVQAVVAILFVVSVIVIAGQLRGEGRRLSSLAVFSLPPPAPFTVKYQVASMTLREKIGQMFLVSFTGTELDEETASWMRTLEIGGVILLGGNITSREQTEKLIFALNDQVSKHAAAPLFISVDQEGGAVSRFKFTDFEMHSQKDIRSSALAYTVALQRAKDLRSLGVNVNFSPVLDVSLSSDDFIYERTFEGDADTVATLGARMVQGYREGGIASAGKHFPGHGATGVNSHIDLPVTERDSKAWSEHLHPFREAIQAEVPMIMMAHLKVPSIDPEFPASLSKIIQEDILRNGLSYKGIIISDDLGMGALTKNYTFPEIALRAVSAGTDILLVVRSQAVYEKMITAIEDAVAKKSISEERIDESVIRILSLKHELTSY
ncbi:MAG: beta-N-acetylhexosaminidase [Parcubacteria group bacterium Gr01-1014_48]|nr:MAG: beta-N-acetylhexosaminidase [Parcubacteria group bacterium Greene0416_14]TSC73638.1 MAG: beta-N-acetylhexosaminidase [Parcubacteria group bacterium Gr01-1014_48]TSD00359.1 MAG: beta-N-acetylhexosaminidase [Parcubacteria group bacterium Greene1014_15]TSD07787.1 MAG: beta-N-acetylhexosaminidase [Parcubacteria group bacterium Greene0714_4]